MKYDCAACEARRTAQLYECEGIKRHGYHVGSRHYHPVYLIEFGNRLYEEKVFQTLQADDEHKHRDKAREHLLVLAVKEPRHHEVKHDAQSVDEIYGV